MPATTATAPTTHRLFIAGAWVQGILGETFDSLKPADRRDVVGSFQAGTAAETAMAIAAAGPRRIVFGEWTGGGPTARVRAILEVCERGGIGAEAASDVRLAKWEKFTLLVAFSAMTAAVRLGLGEIRGAPAARGMLHVLMAEVAAVGRASGETFPRTSSSASSGSSPRRFPGRPPRSITT